MHYALCTMHSVVTRPLPYGHHPATPGAVPEALQRYVALVSYWSGGASLELTSAGIDYAQKDDGAHELARLALALPGWKGHRDEPDVASEIRAHCIAWRWLPPLRGHANPIDLEFYMPWPQNLVLSLWSVIRRCLRKAFRR